MEDYYNPGPQPNIRGCGAVCDSASRDFHVRYVEFLCSLPLKELKRRGIPHEHDVHEYANAIRKGKKP